ncbi:5-methyltetrahydropteroyltriglutamate--homocysteine S-methyltransferase [Nitrosospira multiformis]|uniref:5-methyltetrahydropteroyltriglutamate-- homocysteine S-methyltransferase n=1 Tax=Nitrosospira multiformis TaxID=1231 RepID=UPI0008958DD9|nr:5-methyltetrahydropteroyltriglutamate--homocysteine S-methyltransferase [Nitrosospira multiformis]SEA17980.1 methionine synthase (B12-independent) [Nitrosospira multiformis]
MALTHNLGFPRIGAQRELKRALEAYWRGDIGDEQLKTMAAELRKRHWLLQREQGIDLIPVGDFALYDQMLNMTALLGAIPARFGAGKGKTELDLYFAMARGTADQPAMEMTKWFDTNYHYIVPEFDAHTCFRVGSEQLFREVAETQALSITPKAVLIGPLTYLYLGKEVVRQDKQEFSRLDLLPQLLPVYRDILVRLASLGVEWVQIDEPVLALDLDEDWLRGLDQAYAGLREPADGQAHGPSALARLPKILLATYFDGVNNHAERLKKLPVEGLHIDLCRAPGQLGIFLEGYPAGRVLSLGIIDGRNIWRADLVPTLAVLSHAQALLGERLWIAPSCSLLHCPVDLELESSLEPEIRNWLAFSVQKLKEVSILGQGLNQGEHSIRQQLDASTAARQARRESSRIHNPVVQDRLNRLTEQDGRRKSPFKVRQKLQRERLQLPLLPTTTIGSFPQTAEIRKARAAFRKGELGNLQYLEAMRDEIRVAIRKQEEIGLDVLVHGEAERNDMVEYFGEQLWGYVFTENGWVQSYGSRCVKPPILYGDIYRPEPMTADWIRYAQSQTGKPVKGMLTGPVTMLMWSFVRDDQPRSVTALQLALAIRDEVVDLEEAGIAIIQIDEPAFREGLPLKKRDWNAYLEWAVYAFRVASSGVRDDSQIHTHMCYSEFNDILPAIADMDADVITIETSRSRMELLDGFGHFKYPNEIGPGVYDIHSPRIPRSREMLELLEKACAVIDPDQLWVNPDCGLKTRGWGEVMTALKQMVEAAHLLRTRLGYREDESQLEAPESDKEPARVSAG